MDGIDSDFSELAVDVLSSHHSSIRRRLFSIRGNLHSSGDSAESFLSGDISDVDEGIVPSGQNMGDSDDWFRLLEDVGSKFLDLFFDNFLYFLCHVLRFII